VIKLVVGLLKGAVIGAALGFGAFELGESTGFGNPWLTYGLIGVLVGLFVGRPIWSLLRDQDATSVVSILKAAFGFGLGCGLYALIARAWAPSPLLVGGHDVFSWQPILGGAIGAIYGGFVEIDDAIGDPAPKKKLPAKAAAKKSGPSQPTE